MLRFGNYLTEQKNTHMTHIEDRVLYGGVNGTRQAIFALRDLRDMLGGKKAGNVSVKWDGAPAVFAGIDPNDGNFFVAKKGIFNKNPMVYKTNAEIDADVAGKELNAKLKEALRYLPDLGITGVIQGDFLFSKSEITNQTIAGKKYIVFHPNTIAYAIPAGTPAAMAVKQAKMGIVWHTTYNGSSFETMKASYGVNVSKLKKSKNVWSQDAMLRDLTRITMSAKDTEEVNKKLSEIGFLFNQIGASTLKTLESNIELARTIEMFNNTFVRKGEQIKDTTKHVNALIKWVTARYQKEIDKRKTEKGKNAQMIKRDEFLKFFSQKNKQNLKKIFDLQKLIIVVKLKLINILNKLKSIDTFVKTPNGFKVTGEEGYVAIDKLGGDAVKIVDRLEFSYNNFSPDILKGWDKPGR